MPMPRSAVVDGSGTGQKAKPVGLSNPEFAKTVGTPDELNLMMVEWLVVANSVPVLSKARPTADWFTRSAKIVLCPAGSNFSIMSP